jgi:hypothetical protein
MFNDPISSRRADYFDYVADGFSITIDGVGVLLNWACITIFIVFGWPFAILSWLHGE